jgi:preprotein translocase subunit SecB
MGLAPKSDASNGTNGGAKPADVTIRVLSQYIKDLSFENPGITKQVLAQGENPNLQVEVNVNAQRMATDIYESAITLAGKCQAKAGMLYELEAVYGAVFEVQGMNEQQLEPFLLVNAPALIFPFLRRLVADVTREGGYPPLLLDPIDFASLYLQRRQQPAGDPASA